MTTQELVDKYKSLLIMQYEGKEKAAATIEALVSMVVVDQLFLSIQDCFNIEDAVGDQLDTIAAIVGVSRYGYTFSGPITLSDDELRTTIRLKIITNNAGSSLYEIQSLLQIYFPDTILVYDQKNMHIGYFFDESVGSRDLAEMFVKQGLLPKPMGVQLAATIYSSDIANFFGFVTYETQFGDYGFNTYDNYDENSPWLSYDDAIGS